MLKLEETSDAFRARSVILTSPIDPVNPYDEKPLNSLSQRYPRRKFLIAPLELAATAAVED